MAAKESTAGESPLSFEFDTVAYPPTLSEYRFNRSTGYAPTEQPEPPTQKLYRVVLRGLGSSTGMQYKTSFVVASDPTTAYQKIRASLDARDYGFRHERELESIELLAEDCDYTDVRTRLFL
jgi:hypothetical protein